MLSFDMALVHYNLDLPVELVCDAYLKGILGILMHAFSYERPISYISYEFWSSTEKNYSVIHREALSIYWCVKKFS